jgi:hypothetical protein
MLGLKLRDEFLGGHMPGTAIELWRNDNQGAAQKSPDHILSITYPTSDVQIALSALSANRAGLPIVLAGDRGRGKSHIMAVMHHAVQTPDVVENWINSWGKQLSISSLEQIKIIKGFFPVSEPVHNHEYLLLWDLLFDRHPKGQYYRGQFESMGQPFPPRTLLEKMFEEQPTCLILDEFQTWHAGLPETDPKTGLKLKQYAFNFIQILSEIAKDHPKIFIFVVSVLDTGNEAYQQVHRQGPILINFHGATAKQDRQNLLLHRLFENHRNIAKTDIQNIVAPYAAERFRLLCPNQSEHERERSHREVADSWPFSPELLELLEDHILMSSAAQNTRDLIRILAQVYRSRGEQSPLITPADFFIDGAFDAVQTLVDAVSANQNQARLIEIAQRNLAAVRNAGAAVTHDREMVSAIWMYSLALGLTPGVTTAKLHIAITRASAVDDNTFQAELARLLENSVNIHGDEAVGGHLHFELQENPRSKVRSYAKNSKLWDAGAVVTAGQTSYPGKDIEHLRKTLKAVFVPETQGTTARVIILGPAWKDSPWAEVDDADQPAKWDRPVLLVVPEKFSADKAVINETLGSWLARHVPKKRNTVRFLLSVADAENLFLDKELVFAARCSFLCSKNAWGNDRTYAALASEFDRPLRAALQTRFNRFCILRTWDYQQAKNCVFDVERLAEQGGEIPKAVEEKIKKDLFDQTEFRNLVLAYAKDSEFVSALMDGLAEPPAPGSGDAIPFLGEIPLYENILIFAAEGSIALNVGGSWIVRRAEDASDEDALRYIRPKAFQSLQENRQVQLGLPGVVGSTAVTTAQPPVPPVVPPPLGGAGAITVPDEPLPPVSPVVINKPEAPYPPPVAATKIQRTDEAASGINLSGCFEAWGIPSSQVLDSAKIEFSGLTPLQVKVILQRIPSTFKATLEVSYQEEGEE